METTELRDAYGALLAAAEAVADGDASAPGPGEWDADEILAHVALVSAALLAATAAVAAGGRTTYDNRLSHDPWTLGRVIALTGGGVALRERVRAQGEALCALGCGASLSGPELDTPVPSLLFSHGEPVLDRPLPLRDLLTGLATTELPGHTRQLLALLPPDPEHGTAS